ncbi:hypothetical protein AAC387_Pa09g1228 [Persea americana]
MSIPDINASSSGHQDPPSPWRSPPLPATQKSKVEESDEDLFTVPDVESRPSDSSAAAAATEVQQENGSSSAAGKRRRGRNPADREYKRLKSVHPLLIIMPIIRKRISSGFSCTFVLITYDILSKCKSEYIRRLDMRLLRNRVSAQQARERKKVYVNDLELKARELQDKNSKLEEKISTLTNENTMLRKVLMNTRPKVDESIEPQNDQSGKS